MNHVHRVELSRSVLFALLLIVPGLARAQTTQFSYQGNLRDGGVSANGAYDMTFKLYDTATIGTGIVYGTVLYTNVAVTSGVFTTQVDFGACPACFSGAARFLQVDVKPTSGSTFTTLSPRQPIRSTPYSLRSANAGLADGLSLTCVNCVTSSQIQSVLGSQIAGTIPAATIAGTAATLGSNTFSGAQTISSGNLNLSTGDLNLSGNINKGGSRFIHNYGSQDTFMGQNAGNFAMTNGLNTGVGYNVLTANTSGCCNNAFGALALASNTTGFDNTALGYPSLEFNTTGNQNTAAGAFVLTSNISGSYNTASGVGAMYGNLTGNYNTASGGEVLHDNTAGCCGAAVGFYALHNSTNSFNTAIGYEALQNNSSGANNTAVGSLAGYTTVASNANTTGSNNTFIGANAGAGTGAQFSNASAIGANAVVSQSNALVLGSISGLNGAASSTNVGIGTAVPGQTLTVNGSIGVWGNNKTNFYTDQGTTLKGFVGQGVNLDMSLISKTSGDWLRLGANNGVIAFWANGNADVNSNPSMTLTTGTLQAFGSCIAGSCPSDARFKKNIVPSTPTLEKLAKLQPVRFDWRTDQFPDRHFDSERSFGLIAQDVEKVLPELVTEDDKGYKAVKYNELQLLTVQAVRELKEENDRLRERLDNVVNQQQALILQLQSELTRLKVMASSGAESH